MSLHLCLNCLQPGAKGFPVGNDKGSQRDPFRETIDLCETCKAALESGDFPLLHKRHVAQRTIAAPGPVGEEGQQP